MWEVGGGGQRRASLINQGREPGSVAVMGRLGARWGGVQGGFWTLALSPPGAEEERVLSGQNLTGWGSGAQCL